MRLYPGFVGDFRYDNIFNRVCEHCNAGSDSCLPGAVDCPMADNFKRFHFLQWLADQLSERIEHLNLDDDDPLFLQLNNRWDAVQSKADEILADLHKGANNDYSNFGLFSDHELFWAN